jgi:Platelet-activating factor acetylhydrolase, isoform II
LKLDDSRFPLPAPTGRYQTGRVAFQWIDHQRPELETRAPEDFRELLVYLFYPAQPTARVSRAPYMADADVMSPYWKEDLTNRLKSLPAFSGENAPLLAGRTRFPVVIFAPGGGQKALAYTTLLEDLASHGYVVAAIEPPYNAPAMRFPDGTTIGRLARLMPSVRGGSAHVTIARVGIEHLDFSDNPFWSTTTSPEVLAGKRRTIAVTRAYVRAFFDGCLKGEWGSFRRLTAASAKAYPEVSSRAFGPMAAR